MIEVTKTKIEKISTDKDNLNLILDYKTERDLILKVINMHGNSYNLEKGLTIIGMRFKTLFNYDTKILVIIVKTNDKELIQLVNRRNKYREELNINNFVVISSILESQEITLYTISLYYF